MNKSKFQVAIISAGRMASTIDDEVRASDVWPSLKRQLPYSHAPCYRQFPEIEIVAVCDIIEDKCKEFCRRWNVPRYYLDYREMIEREQPDIVSIATAASMHAEMAIFAMEQSVKGIYSEKAMCCSLKEADAIVDCVRRHNVVFMLGAQRRHHPILKKAREIIDSGEIGELVCVASWVEGALLHSLSHTADGSLYLAGDAVPVSVYGILGSVRSLDDVEKRRVRQAAEYDAESKRWNGDPGCLTFTASLTNGVFLNHMPAVTNAYREIICTNGYMRIVNNTDALYLFKRRGKSWHFDPVELPPIPQASSHVELVRDLLGCLRTGRKPLANEIVARYGMEILVGVAQSHLEGGRTVAIPLKDRDMYIPSH